MLSKMPRVRDGRVVFRKKPGRAKYMIAVLEMDEHVHLVLYRMSVVYDGDTPIHAMSFRDYRRN
jgi:hypothetical protein